MTLRDPPKPPALYQPQSAPPWRPTWRLQAPQDASQIPPRRPKMSQDSFWCHFASKNLPTWLPKSTKIDEKSMPRYHPMLTSFFDRFLIDFWSIFRPPEPQKSLKFHLFYRYFCKIGLSKLTSIFDPILVPTWLHFPSQNPPKSFQKPIPGGINFLIDFWMDFLSILAPTWDPTWGQVGAMLATFPAQDASKTPPRRSKMPSKILWIAQDGPRGLQTCSGALQSSILEDFWWIFVPFFIDFWLIFCFFFFFFIHFKIQNISVSKSSFGGF